MIAHCLFADAQSRADRAVIETLRDQFQNIVLAHGKVVDQRRYTRRLVRCGRQKFVDLAYKLLPGGLALKQYMIAPLQRHKTSAWNKPGKIAALLKGNPAILPDVGNERRTTNQGSDPTQ